jgi:small subunit ribosomal protein S20
VNQLANIKSSIKSIKKTEVQTLRNRSIKSAMKTACKKAIQAINDKTANAEELYKTAIIALDKAATKNVIHKNAAARKKSQLTKAFNSMNA